MRREGRQHGWVSTVDAEGKRHAVEGAATANGGFVRAPRKPTNHSKPTSGRPYKELSSSTKGKVRHKFKHHEVKMYYLEGAAAAVDVYDDMDA
ncbi:hypothetical protein BS78_K316600 [Paspalum vaginatum]|uniref:Uncharacterized protein n=1 Tax=Paspalum vaginatum TaxID=158149 RepID=A0A9W7X9H4_9POAL|nr:hypothetical protein BS78_K316600 [Paspalum vaginatum]